MSAVNAPALRIPDKSKITVQTQDCFANQLNSDKQKMDALDWERINPATGPLYIEGAMPGDTLKIAIDEIKTAGWGIMAAIPGAGVLGSVVEESQIKRIRVQENTAWFTEEIHLPCHPMIGVIGVAPREGGIPCGEPGSHGGNMDNTKIAAGSTLYLPVFHPGALLAMGDVHACMGDGEIMVSGLEIPAEVTVTVEVLKNITIEDPMLEDKHACYTIASHEDLEKAIFTATHTMTKILMAKKNLSLNDAGMLLSAAGNLQFCQVVDPKRTVRMEVKKTLLDRLI